MRLDRSPVVVAIVAMLLPSGAAPAHEQMAGSLRIAHAWVRAAGPGAAETAGYVIEIENKATQEERLVGATLSVAGKGVLRRMVTSGATRQFAVIADGLPIPAGKSIELTPDGVQIYFPDLKQPLVAGELVAGTLEFAKSGSAAIEFMIEPASLDENADTGGRGGMPGHDNHPHHH